MKRFTLLFLILGFLSCQDKEANMTSSNVTNPSDYNSYLELDESSQVDSLKKEVAQMQQESNGDTTRIVLNGGIASKLDRLFDLTGDVNYLNESVRFRESVANNTYIQPDNPRRTLAQAYIKQHRFKKADSLMTSITKDYSGAESQLVQFDVAMELGNYEFAERLLDSLRDTGDYNYLIRAAKWNDHIGQLDTTISLMERAMKLAEQSGVDSRKIWSYSNIADYYGHNGQLEESYEHYLKTLELDPYNTYALKGIAWIAYSNDKDVDESRTILTRLQERHPIPDYNLELAELAAFEGDEATAIKLKSDFMNRVADPAYAEMYNAYKIIELIDDDQAAQAVALATREIGNRATPETYDLLGYALLANGQEKEALENQEKYVIGKTFEPVAQLHTALILKKNGQVEQMNAFKNELLETSYEMGPLTFKEIESL